MSRQIPLPAGPEAWEPDRDERLGEVIETYLELVESGQAPDPDRFADGYPDLSDELRSALEGLDLVQGLVGGPRLGLGPTNKLPRGCQIAGYRIICELGRGGMGVVYEAEHLGLQRRVALKVLGTHATPDSTSRRRFLHEARTAASLHHTHIVPVFDVGQTGGLCYYAMQRIEGSSLDRVIRLAREQARTRLQGAMTLGEGATPLHDVGQVSDSPPAPGELAGQPQTGGHHSRDDLTQSWNGIRLRGGDGTSLVGGGHPDGLRAWDDTEAPALAEVGSAELPELPASGTAYHRWVAEIGRQAGQALGHAHRQGIVHRDVKPSNLLIEPDGSLWVTDFGLARNLEDPSLTATQNLVGTPRYMSPEQIEGSRQIDARTDVYSLGATLYELLVLRPPSEGSSAAELARQTLYHTPTRPRQIDSRIPRDLETILLKALAKRSADRYRDGTELAEDLQRFLRGEPVRARRISPVGRFWRLVRRYPASSLVCGLAILLTLGVSLAAYFSVVQERDKAQHERDLAQQRRDQAEEAKLEAKLAQAQELVTNAELIRRTHEPNRRRRGLESLHRAAQLVDAPGFQGQLRDEAVELLALRDVKQVAAGIQAQQPIRGLGFIPSDRGEPDGLEVIGLVAQEQIDDRGRLRETMALHVWPVPDPEIAITSTSQAGSIHPSEPIFERTLDSSTSRGRPNRLVVTQRGLATYRYGSEALHWYDEPTSLQPPEVWTFTGKHLLGVWIDRHAERMVTLDQPRDLRRNDTQVLEVHLWELHPGSGEPVRPLKRLRRWQWSPADRSSPRPLVALDGRGSIVAITTSRSSTVELFDAQWGTRWASEELGTENISLANSSAAVPIESVVDVGGSIFALALSHDGVLAVSSTNSIGLWDLPSGQVLPRIGTNQSFVRTMKFSPGGTVLAVSGFGEQVELWDPAQQTLIAQISSRGSDVEALQFSSRGTRLGLAYEDGRINLWQIEQPVGRHRPADLETWIADLDFHPAESTLLISGEADEPIHAWSPDHRGRAAWPCAWSLDCRDEPEGESEGSDRSVQASRSYVHARYDDQGRVTLLDAESLRVIHVCSRHAHEVARVDFGQSGVWPPPTVWSSNRSRMVLFEGQQFLIWSSEHPDEMPVVKLPQSRGTLACLVGLDEAGRYLHLMHEDHYEIWDLGTSWPAAGDAIDARLVQSWSTPIPLRNLISRPALSADGTRLALAESANQVWILNTRDGRVEATLKTKTAPSTSTGGRGTHMLYFSRLQFTPDGQHLAVGLDNQVSLWNFADKAERLVCLPVVNGLIRRLDFDASGRRLAIVSRENDLVVWDLARIRQALRQEGLDWTGPVGETEPTLEPSLTLLPPTESGPSLVEAGRENRREDRSQPEQSTTSI